ncbi:MAG TPA: O-antigen polymerase [Cellvibrio sp.]|nr:O-antigen polymerase [Cellvibrio sp.]
MISLIVLGIIAWWIYFLFIRLQAASHPAFLFSIYWFAILVFAEILSGHQLNIDFAAIYILAAVLAFSGPALLFKRVAMPVHNSIDNKPRFLSMVFIVLLIVVITGIIFHIQAQGLSITTALKEPDKFGGDFIGLRYNGKVVSTLYIQIATSLNFVCASICGLIVANDRRYFTPALFTIAAFIPSITTMFLLGDKGTLPQSIAFYCGGLFVGWIKEGKTSIMTKRTALFFSIGICVLIPIVIIAMIIKIIGKFQIPNSQIIESLQDYLRSYSIGGVYAFSDWLRWHVFEQQVNTNYIQQTDTLGVLTFWGLAKYLPTTYQMPAGYYLEYFEVEGVVRTNVYTAFRGLIIDFSLPGSLIFLSGLGYASAATYRSMLLKYSALSQTFYIVLIGAIYASSFISLGTWSSPFVATVLLFLILYRCSLRY